MNVRQDINPVVGCIGALFITALSCGIIYLCMEMFEYSIFSMFGIDLAWYWDIIGAFIFNGINLPVWFICFILRSAGWEVPFFEGN